MRTTWLIDARTLASRPTGVGMYVVRLLRRLMRGEEPDITNGEACRFVLVCDVKESAAIVELEAMGADVRVYGRRVFNSMGVIGYFCFVKSVVDEVRPDVFWQPNNVQPFRPKGAGRVIVTMHDIFGLRGWSWRYLPWHLYYYFSFWRTLGNATEIWFNSHQTEHEVREVAPRQVARLVTRVTHPIAEVPPRENVKPYGDNAQGFFLYLGNIEQRKGADILIEAYRRYRAQGGRVRLIFAGVEKNVKVPRDAGVDVLGYVSDELKYSLMCACKALIVPSRAEGYGMQVAEAAALGVRCIASDLPVFGEIDATGRTTLPVGDVGALVKAMFSAG